MLAELMNHLWQSTLFTMVAWLATLVFRKHQARVRHGLWVSASVKFLVPFSMLMTLGSRVELAPIGRPVSTVVERVVEPFPEAILPVAVRDDSRDWTAVLAGLWLCGLLAVVAIRWRGWLRIRAAVRASRLVDLPSPLAVRSTPGLLEPGVVGFWRPTLLLPAGIEQRLSAEQLAAVLAHELCHVRRRDNWLSAVHMVVEAVFWFYPLVWWIGARLLEERERACDEEVVRWGSEPQVYAEAIIEVCRHYVESPIDCVPGVTGADLKHRIEDILANRVVAGLTPAWRIGLVAAAVIVVLLQMALGVLRAQDAKPKFEVASVRPCRAGDGVRMGAGYSSTPGRLRTGCMLLVDERSLGLIQRAYVRFANGRPQPLNIVPIKGGPAWIRSEPYEINATAAGNAPPPMMEGPMMQSLLEERFGLKIRRETSDGPVYELSVAKSGPRLKAFVEGSCVPMPLTFPRPMLAEGQKHCKTLVALPSGSVQGEGSTLEEFARLLALAMDRPVLDRTGIAGRYDLRVDYGADADDPMARMAAIFPAIEAQLGLRLSSAKGPRESIVIDRVERPSAN
jgi:bla regulator protein BlaR1